MDYMAELPTPLGPLTLVSDGVALTAARFGSASGPLSPSLAVFRAAGLWLDRYWQGLDPGPVPFPLRPRGTAFQCRVWDRVRQIPWGRALTYGDLARQIARAEQRPCPQAVGQALGCNPIALFIPCHRVLGAGGRLTGYAWGLARKRQLLTLERIPFV